MPKLVFINGSPGVGKTTLALELEKLLAIKFLTKDGIKEYLFDTVGSGDRERSALIGRIAADTLYIYTEYILESGQNVYIENAFWADFAAERLRGICLRTNSDCLELYCYTDDKTRTARYTKRVLDGTRHKGHGDEVNLQLLGVHKGTQMNSNTDTARYRPTEIGDIIRIDTSELGQAGYRDIAGHVKTFLSRVSA